MIYSFERVKSTQAHINLVYSNSPKKKPYSLKDDYLLKPEKMLGLYRAAANFVTYVFAKIHTATSASKN